jgi:LysM repeat protein
VHLPKLAVSLAALLVLVAAQGASAFTHVVTPGESLSSIAATDGVTVTQLAEANGLGSTAELLSGSQLTIPPQAGEAQLQAAIPVSSDADGDADGALAGESASTTSQYVVQPGDTLSALAARAGVTVAQLAAANGLDAEAPLLAGASLTLGAGVSGRSPEASTASAAQSQPVGEAAQGSPGSPPYTTQQTVSSAEISSIAAANGVPASLAEAIAYQESGFNNELVSSADARGVMQITPGTWSWINEALAGPTPLDPESALENVRGGVLLLRSLLQATGGDEELAAAGYYQGLPSVLSEGMYPSTQQYVADVRALQQSFGGG